MAKRALPIDLYDMQRIIDREEGSYNGGLINFFNHCCDIYNEKHNPNKPLNGNILYNRMKKGEIKTTFVKTRNPREMTPEHKEKIIQGLKNRKRNSRANKDSRHEEYLQRELRDHPKLAERILQGSMSAAVKAKCIDCCCGDKNEIRHCTSYGCPLWNFRPYQQKAPCQSSCESV